MERLRRFEATSLEDALAQVRGEMGDDARIVSAEKVRRGGVAGFFAKETFEIMVDVDDDAAGATAEDAPAASILDLADAVSAAEAMPIQPVMRRPALSTESRSFAAVLERISAEAADDAVADSASSAPVEPPAHDAVSDHAAAAHAAAAHAAADQADQFAALRPKPFVPPVVRRPEPAPAAPAPVVAATPAAPLPAPAPRPAAAPAVSPAPAATTLVRREFAALQALGLPEAYLPEHDDRDLAHRLAIALSRLPQPPALPVWTGSVVAVVGPRDEALPLARELSTVLGRDPKEIALACPAYRGKQVPQWLQIPTAQVAEEQRRSWRRRSTPTVVVVDAPVGGKNGAWANEVLDALEPSLSWGVVDATRKTIDVAAWSRGIGGVDVLAVKRIDETVAPAEILSLGIPVGRLDDETATPERWARVLRERLAAA